MVVYAKVRAGFSAAVGDVAHEGGVIVAVTETEFKAITHAVEEMPGDVARLLHRTKGHALAISPAVVNEREGIEAIAEAPAASADAHPVAQEGA